MGVFTQETTWTVDYSDIEDLINKHFHLANGKFEIMAHEELNNDSVFEVDVDCDELLEDYDYDMMKSGKLHWQTNNILNVMARQGILPFTKGKLYINVSY